MTRNFSHPEAGVTLIEILIAVSLLSLLSVGVLVAMRLGFNTMDKIDNRLVSDRRVSYARQIIESEISGFTYTLADVPVRTGGVMEFPFSQWAPQTMRFVTSYSLQDAWRGRPQIAALQVIPGENGQGVRLIVNETPYTGGAQAGQTVSSVDTNGNAQYVPVTAGPQSFVLADKLAYCRFSYLDSSVPTAPFQIWRSDWSQPRLIPQGVRIDMVPLDGSRGDLHVSTVTATLHINRTPGELYDDKP